MIYYNRSLIPLCTPGPGHQISNWNIQSPTLSHRLKLTVSFDPQRPNDHDIMKPDLHWRGKPVQIRQYHGSLGPLLDIRRHSAGHEESVQKSDLRLINYTIHSTDSTRPSQQSLCRKHPALPGLCSCQPRASHLLPWLANTLGTSNQPSASTALPQLHPWECSRERLEPGDRA